MNKSESTEARLARALAECQRLQTENRQLRKQLDINPAETHVEIVSKSSNGVAVSSKSSPGEKVKLFRSLFRGREDLYPNSRFSK